jgi:hypothetical protein
MKTTWDSLRAVWWVIGLLSAVAVLVLGVASFFTGDTAWLSAATMIMCVFSLPASYADVIRSVRGPKPRPSPRLLLTRWPILLLCFGMVALFGWAVWFGFGRVWMGTLAAFGLLLPAIALLATVALMEPGPRKDRAYLASTVAMFAIPLLMVAIFAVVYGKSGR